MKLYANWLSPPTLAVGMICEAVGVKPQVHILNLLAGEQNSQAFLKINPDHCVPTIDDDGFILWESNAVARYIMNKFAPNNSLYPQNVQKRALVDKMLDFSLSVVQKTMFEFVGPQLYLNKDMPTDAVEAMVQRLNDQIFAGKRFSTGDDLTIADIFIMTALVFGEAGGYKIPPGKFPNVNAWMKRMEAQPFYQKMAPLHNEAKQGAKKATGRQNIILSNL